MYCRQCGKEINEDTQFCPACGAKQFEEANQSRSSYNDPFDTTATAEVEKPAKCWYVFALIGKILGIVSLCVSLIPGYGLAVGIPGIVMSCLGRKAVGDGAERNSSLGLKLSIIATAIGFVVFIVYIIVCVSLGVSSFLGIFREISEM